MSRGDAIPRRPLVCHVSSDPILDDQGLRSGEDGASFLWKELRRIACYIDWSAGATCETDYLAFQTRKPDETWWIDLTLRQRADRFRKELEERVGFLDYPRMGDLTPGTSGGDWGYVLWPREECGEPLYAALEVRRWFIFTRKHLIYAKGASEP